MYGSTASGYGMPAQQMGTNYGFSSVNYSTGAGSMYSSSLPQQQLDPCCHRGCPGCPY